MYLQYIYLKALIYILQYYYWFWRNLLRMLRHNHWRWKFNHTRRLWPLSREESSSCHICTATGTRLCCLVQRNAPFQRLLRKGLKWLWRFGPVLFFFFCLTKNGIGAIPAVNSLQKLFLSVNFSHFKINILLLENNWANFIQTWHKASNSRAFFKRKDRLNISKITGAIIIQTHLILWWRGLI